jgi:hypothetical protein
VLSPVDGPVSPIAADKREMNAVGIAVESLHRGRRDVKAAPLMPQLDPEPPGRLLRFIWQRPPRKSTLGCATLICQSEMLLVFGCGVLIF